MTAKDFLNIIETYEIKGNHNTAFIAVSAVKSRIPKCVFGGDIAHLYDCMDELLHDELMVEIARQVLANKRKKL